MTNILSFVLGGILTILVSWFFYKRSIQKNAITPFLDYFSKVFDQLDPELKKDLILQYKGKEIDFLYDIQFTLKNTGNKSIRSIIEPLALQLPLDLEVMDAKIIDISPKGRNIELEQLLNSNLLTIRFLLLNPGEEFKLKLLLKGDITKLLSQKRVQLTKTKIEKFFEIEEDEIKDETIIDDFKFTITVDDLPPQLKIKKVGHIQNDEQEFSMFNGFIYLVVGLPIGYILWTYTHTNEELYLPNFKKFFSSLWASNFNLLKWSIFICWIVSFSLTVRGAIEFIVPLIRRIVYWIEKKVQAF